MGYSILICQFSLMSVLHAFSIKHHLDVILYGFTKPITKSIMLLLQICLICSPLTLTHQDQKHIAFSLSAIRIAMAMHSSMKDDRFQVKLNHFRTCIYVPDSDIYHMLLDILLFFSPGLELCCIGGLCNGAGTSCKPIPKPCTYLLKVICISFSLSPKILATTNLVQSIWECIQQNHLQDSGNKLACHLQSIWNVLTLVICAALTI